MKKLDFIIVGAMKAGTSSLAYQLKFNPQICMPLSEVHYFNNDKNYNQGIEWYEDIFKDCEPDNTIGEKTPTYSYQENVPKRIHEYNPSVKIVWIFRDPVSRAYSNYWHAVKSGRENYSFATAVRKESERVKKDIWKGYLKRSIYVEQIERYLKFFDTKQMYFMLFEDFIQNPVENMKGIFKFLEVPFNNYEYQDEIKNITIIPRIPRLLRKTSDTFHEKSIILKGITYLAVKGRKPGYPKLSPELRQELNPYFNEHNKKLEELTGLDLSIWDKKKRN